MKSIPQRKRIPLITDLIAYKRIKNDPLKYFAQLVHKYGDVFYAPTAQYRSYYIHDPEILKEVFINQAGYFQKSDYYRLMKKLTGEGLFTSEGKLHHRQRRLAAPAFHKDRIHQYASVMINCTLAEMQHWQVNDLIDMRQAMTNITLQVITQTLFGTGIDPERISHISSLVSQMLGTATQIFENPIYVYCLEKNINIPIVRKFNEHKRKLDALIFEIIDKYRDQDDPGCKNLLGMLIHARDADNGDTMDDEQVRDEVMTMFFAGHETTATALSWAWYLLGRHEEINNAFYSEVHAVTNNGTPDPDDYASLQLTKNIFRETLRLYPPAWMIAREAQTDVVLNEHHFPKGSVLITLLYLMHRKEKYFEHPDQFIPDRWTDTGLQELPRFAYFPFGGGNRMCIGEGFAWMEAVLILSTVASRYRLALQTDFTTLPAPGFTLRPASAIPMRVVAAYKPE